MLNYLFQRLLLLIPMLVVISLLGFGVKQYTATDPAEGLQKPTTPTRTGGNLPVFYFTVSTYAFPDTLYQVNDPTEREALSALIYKHGNWPQIANYYKALKQLAQKQASTPLDSIGQLFFTEGTVQEALTQSRFGIRNLLTAHRDAPTSRQFKELKALYAEYPFLADLRKPLQEAHKAYVRMLSMRQPWKNYLPVVHWWGSVNQYHQWVSGIITNLDFGESKRSGEPVMERLQPKLGWTFGLAFLAILTAYIVSLPVGVYAAYRRNKSFDRISGGILFALAALPNFFVGTLLIFFFANPDMLPWFPESGVYKVGSLSDDQGFWEKVRLQVPYLVLPFLTYLYGEVAYLSRHMRAGMLEILPREFIRTARAKGLRERQVLVKHAFKNAILPVITLFTSVFPLALGSAVIVEGIFAIPGVGWELYQAILRADYPVIVAIFSIVGLVMLVSFLLVDLLYALIDPRISNQQP